jgi:phosphoadenosine phosphosulfate reductase
MDLILTSPQTRLEISKEQLKRKIERGIKLLLAGEKVAKENSNQPLEICYSGGKDSDVILRLAQMAGCNYRAIYKNTTIDPSGTPAHAKKMGAEIVMPELSFRQLVERHGAPSRYRRFCCSILKEYKILDYAVVGIRRSESAKRANRYTEPELCRFYSKKEKVRQYLPILDWTDEDVKLFVETENIECHPLYYNEIGEFCPDRRLGCMGCPLVSQGKRRAEFIKNPKMLRLYINALKVFRETHPYPENKLLNDVYKEMAFTLFASNEFDFRVKFGKTMFDKEIDCKVFLEDYFNVALE